MASGDFDENVGIDEDRHRSLKLSSLEPRRSRLTSSVLSALAALDYELPHSCPALFAVTEIAFAHCLPDEIGHGGLFPASASVERSPQLVVEIQLRAPHAS